MLTVLVGFYRPGRTVGTARAAGRVAAGSAGLGPVPTDDDRLLVHLAARRWRSCARPGACRAARRSRSATRVGGLGDVGRRRVGVGVGVRVEDPDDLGAARPRRPGRPAGGPAGRRCRAWPRPPCCASGSSRTTSSGLRVAGQEPAGLVGQARQAVADHLQMDLRRQSQHRNNKRNDAWRRSTRTPGAARAVRRGPGGSLRRDGTGKEDRGQARGGPRGGGTLGRPRRRQQPPGPPRLRHPRDLRVRDRAPGQRGEVAAGRQGPALRRLRPGDRRRAVALRRPHPALAVRRRLRRRTTPTGGASSCSTATRSTS